MPPTKRGAPARGKGAAAGAGKKEAKKTAAAGAAGEKSVVMELGGEKVKMTYRKALGHWETLMRCKDQSERDSLIKQNMDLGTAMYGPIIVTQHGPMDRNVLTSMTLFDDDLEDVKIHWMPIPMESDFGPEMITVDNEDMASQVFLMPWYVSMVQALAVVVEKQRQELKKVDPLVAEVQKLRQKLKKVEPLVAEVNQLRQEAGRSGSSTPVNEAAEDGGAADGAGAGAEDMDDDDDDDDDDEENILFIRSCCEGSVHVCQIPVSEMPSDLTDPLARYLETGWNGVIVENSNDPSSFSKQEQEISKYVESGEYNLAELFEELMHQDFDKYLVQPGGDLKTTHKYMLVMF